MLLAIHEQATWLRIAGVCWSGVSRVFYVPIMLTMYALSACSVRMRQCNANVCIKKRVKTNEMDEVRCQ